MLVKLVAIDGEQDRAGQGSRILEDYGPRCVFLNRLVQRRIGFDVGASVDVKPLPGSERRRPMRIPYTRSRSLSFNKFARLRPPSISSDAGSPLTLLASEKLGRILHSGQDHSECKNRQNAHGTIL